MSVLKHGIRNWNLWPPMPPFGCQGNWKRKWRRILHGIPFTRGTIPNSEPAPSVLHCIVLARRTSPRPPPQIKKKRSSIAGRHCRAPRSPFKIRCTAGRRKRPLAAARSRLGEAVAGGGGGQRAARRSRCARPLPRPPPYHALEVHTRLTSLPSPRAVTWGVAGVELSNRFLGFLRFLQCCVV